MAVSASYHSVVLNRVSVVFLVVPSFPFWSGFAIFYSMANTIDKDIWYSEDAKSRYPSASEAAHEGCLSKPAEKFDNLL